MEILDQLQEELVPIQLLIGWLPKVASKDARLYVEGLADKHCNNLKESGFLIYPFEGGWAYEIQEGGTGKGYLPQILKVLAAERKQDLPLADTTKFVIQTAQRRVQVELQNEGLLAIHLPESTLTPVTDGLTPDTSLRELLPERRNVMFVGAAVLVAGVITFGTALIWRYQPQLTPSPVTVAYVKNTMPFDQWGSLSVTKLPAGTAVTKLEYTNNKWEIVKGPAE